MGSSEFEIVDSETKTKVSDPQKSTDYEKKSLGRDIAIFTIVMVMVWFSFWVFRKWYNATAAYYP